MRLNVLYLKANRDVARIKILRLFFCLSHGPSVHRTEILSMTKRNCSKFKHNTGYAPFMSEGFVTLLEGHESVGLLVRADYPFFAHSK